MAPTIMYENCQFCLKPKRVLAQRECESRQGGRKGNSSTRSHAWENKCFCNAHQMKHMPFFTFWYHFVRNQFFMVLALVALLNFWDRKWQQDEGSGSLPLTRCNFSFKPLRRLSSTKETSTPFQSGSVYDELKFWQVSHGREWMLCMLCAYGWLSSGSFMIDYAWDMMDIEL